jgi:hypothetical protein
MTVLHPWPVSVPSAHRRALDGVLWPGVRRPPGPVKAEAPPPCEPMAWRFASHFHLDLPGLAKVRPALVRHVQGLRAGTAELVLLNRLRARTRRGPGSETLERAASIIEVTARHWFGDAQAAPEPG